MMTHKIHIVERALSDNSKVYDVEFGDNTIPAITLRDAESMAYAIAAAINCYSNDGAIALHMF